MRVAILLTVLFSFAFADGGLGTCRSTDYTTDNVTSTVWKGNLIRIRRNGVVVTTGIFHPPGFPDTTYSFSRIGQFTLTAHDNSSTNSWNKLELYGGDPFPWITFYKQ